MASIKYFRVYQLNKILCLGQTDLRQNLPLAFLDQSACISQDWHFSPWEVSVKWQINFLIKKEKIEMENV